MMVDVSRENIINIYSTVADIANIVIAGFMSLCEIFLHDSHTAQEVMYNGSSTVNCLL